jgi:hypothetical protein
MADLLLDFLTSVAFKIVFYSKILLLLLMRLLLQKFFAKIALLLLLLKLLLLVLLLLLLLFVRFAKIDYIEGGEVFSKLIKLLLYITYD